MVSLSLMARLIEALRSDARLVLVGDPGQLASIEAGAVLGDIVGAAARRRRRASARASSVLVRGQRFGDEIARLAAAIRAGDADAVIALLRESPGARRLARRGPRRRRGRSSADARRRRARPARAVIEAARADRAADALAALARFRLLCAHRRGPIGVSTWTARIETWLESEVAGFSARERWYVGRPLLVTENDYELGSTTATPASSSDRRRPRAGRVRARRRAGPVSPSRLGAVDTVYAMTIHKSQGSQFQAAAVLLPEPGSRMLTRELLYTAVTRAQAADPRRHRGDVRAAVERPVARASGLAGDWRLTASHGTYGGGRGSQDSSQRLDSPCTGLRRGFRCPLPPMTPSSPPILRAAREATARPAAERLEAAGIERFLSSLMARSCWAAWPTTAAPPRT